MTEKMERQKAEERLENLQFSASDDSDSEMEEGMQINTLTGEVIRSIAALRVRVIPGPLLCIYGNSFFNKQSRVRYN